jgi:hypothetical protein
MYIMTENPADETPIENACQDIDRYISEMAQPSPSDAQLLSPSQRLRMLGMQQAGSSKTQLAVQETATGLPTNKL